MVRTTFVLELCKSFISSRIIFDPHQIREGIRKDMGDGTAINTRGYHGNVVERDTLLPWQRSKTRQPVTIAT